MSVWFCLASGPSMTAEDAELVRGHGNVIAINNTAQLAPWADVLYACDVKWWRTYGNEPWVRNFRGRKVCLDTQEPTPAGVEALPWDVGEGLGYERIRTGSNSGYQAINYAYLQGAKTIVLLGYDMQVVEGRPAHWHVDHPKRIGNVTQRASAEFRHRMRYLADDLEAEGVKVINCSRKTALECFEREPVENVLGRLSYNMLAR